MPYTKLGGLDLHLWGDPVSDKYASAWATYEGVRPATGYEAAWVMMCIKDDDGADSETLLTEVVNQIHLRDPGIPIYLSPINQYAAGHVCGRIGARGFDVGAAMVEWGIANLGVDRGPVTGVLTTDLLRSDMCHLNQAGIDLVGAQLVEWFDNGGWQIAPDPEPGREPLPPIDPSELLAPLGVVGCSNTVEHIRGYHTVSEIDKFWDSTTIPYAGGTVTEWGKGGTAYWTDFEANAASQPPSAVWIQICLRGSDSSALAMSVDSRSMSPM